jgi:hypothetical protein
MGKLYYPTLDLFIYDLKAPLNSSPEEVIDNRQKFIAKLPPDHQFNDREQEEYYWGKKIELSSKTPGLEPLKFYPVRLHDVYGLRLDCSIDNLTEPQAINTALPLLYQEIQSQAKIDELTFGKTWLVSGWLAAGEHQTPEESAQKIAKDCYQYLAPKVNWEQNLSGQGHFLNGYIFQLGQSLSDADEQIVILLLPNREMAEKASKFYTDWMLLFCFYHKILLAYRQSRLIKQFLTNHYQKVDNYAKIINDPNRENPNATKSLDTIQDILNQYSIDLLNLSFQKQTITTNLLNYQIRVEQIKDKAGNESDLNFLDKFSILVEKKYLIQIDKDVEIMQLGLKLLETNLNAIRSRIELEKSERDRNFQNIITIVGSGTAIATFIDFKGEKCQAIFKQQNKLTSIKSVSGSQNSPKNYPDFCNNFWIGSFLIPIVFLIILGAIGLALKKIIQKFN